MLIDHAKQHSCVWTSGVRLTTCCLGLPRSGILLHLTLRPSWQQSWEHRHRLSSSPRPCSQSCPQQSWGKWVCAVSCSNLGIWCSLARWVSLCRPDVNDMSCLSPAWSSVASRVLQPGWTRIWFQEVSETADSTDLIHGNGLAQGYTWHATCSTGFSIAEASNFFNNGMGHGCNGDAKSLLSLFASFSLRNASTTIHDDLRQTKIVQNSFRWHGLLEYINNAY